MNFPLRSRTIVEFAGTAFLLMAIVGSGIMAERLASGNVALALLANEMGVPPALPGRRAKFDRYGRPSKKLLA
jgi:glycerol uptake facilitator-like aquaporin